ncbi:MAG: 1-deoxy-D-xylulose-5-phosphate synthase [Coriobacteriales bacterium]|nr:1-deoxy-D-xylulose-5-phosphate synthase [Coriobacteriales bacterium]
MHGRLEQIESPADVRRLGLDELVELADEIRSTLVTCVGTMGGHLASNLGFVEATIALHYVFNTPTDQLVFDVSHQCYAHKMLTGRASSYTDPSRYGTHSGFTNPDESEYDLFRAGHTSQGVSLACGLAKARDLLGKRHNVIAVIGDGSLSGGEAFEGLDNAATVGTNLIVVLNDNEMSIAPNSGGIYEHLAALRQAGGKSGENLFRTMGLDYRYVADGNDVRALVHAFAQVKDIDHPIVVHIHTRKGKGYAKAEQDPEATHFVAPASAVAPATQTYQEVTREVLGRKMRLDPSVIVVNAGAPSGVGLTPEFRAACGTQFFDTGITEPHAVAFCAGMAKGGAKPVFMVMATFAQRAFDQFIQELGLNRSPVTVLVFGAGFYDIDATHAGTFDIVTTGNVPGLTCLAPATCEEYVDMLEWSIDQRERPVVIRVPERMIEGGAGVFDPTHPGRWHVAQAGGDIAFLSIGATCELARRASALLASRDGVHATLVEAINYSSFDEPLLDDLLANHRIVVTLEPGILCGGFGEKVARYFGKTGMRVMCYGGKKEFLDRVPTEEFFKIYHFTAEDIVADIEALELGTWHR